jgi:MFS family permease
LRIVHVGCFVAMVLAIADLFLLCGSGLAAESPFLETAMVLFGLFGFVGSLLGVAIGGIVIRIIERRSFDRLSEAAAREAKKPAGGAVPYPPPSGGTYALYITICFIVGGLLVPVVGSVIGILLGYNLARTATWRRCRRAVRRETGIAEEGVSKPRTSPATWRTARWVVLVIGLCMLGMCGYTMLTMRAAGKRLQECMHGVHKAIQPGMSAAKVIDLARQSEIPRVGRLPVRVLISCGLFIDGQYEEFDEDEFTAAFGEQDEDEPTSGIINLMYRAYFPVHGFEVYIGPDGNVTSSTEPRFLFD